MPSVHGPSNPSIQSPFLPYSIHPAIQAIHTSAIHKDPPNSTSTPVQPSHQPNNSSPPPLLSTTPVRKPQRCGNKKDLDSWWYIGMRRKRDVGPFVLACRNEKAGNSGLPWQEFHCISLQPRYVISLEPHLQFRSTRDHISLVPTWKIDSFTPPNPKHLRNCASPEPPSPDFEIYQLLRPYLHPAQLK